MRKFTACMTAVAVGLFMAASPANAFNPQPDPPGKTKKKVSETKAKSNKPTNPGAAKGFNPQPDPPGKTKYLSVR